MRERHLPGAPTSRAWRSAPYARCRTARRRHEYADARLGFRWGTAPAFHSRRKQRAARHVRDEIYRAACVATAPFDALRSCAPPLVRGPRQSKMNERRIVPHGSTSWRRLCRCVGAPSVCLPENVIPSAGATRASFQRRQSSRSFCLRVSGAVAPSASEDRSLPRQFRYALIFDLALSFLIVAFRHRDLRVSRLSRHKVSSKWRADATIEYTNSLAAIPRRHWSTPGRFVLNPCPAR